MYHSEPARIASRRTRSAILAVLVFFSATLIGAVTVQWVGPKLSHPRTRTEAAGAVSHGLKVYDKKSPAVTHLDPDLLRALRKAATDAAKYKVEIVVNSGWRSPEYQDRLFRQAVSKYGSKEKAERWVATLNTSSHVSGHAVDIGPARAMAWLSKHGAAYRLCQIYRNEPWHYELRPEALNNGCPAMYADPGHDPRMHP